MNNLKLLFAFLVQYFKVRLAQPLELLLETIITVLADVANVLVLLVIIKSSKFILNWSGHENMLLFGYMLLTGTISEFAIGNVRSLGADYIRTGKLDLLLVRPISTFLQLMIGEIRINQLGSALIGIIICIVEIINLKLSLWAIPVLLFGIVPAIAILVGIVSIISATDFWSKSPLNPLHIIEDVRQLAYYPLQIYPFVIKFILYTVLPFAFTGYVQVSVALGKLSYYYLAISLIVSVVIILISIILWNRGIKKYESAG